MKTQIKILCISILSLLFFNNCFQDFFIDGNGEIVEELRSIPDFTEISSSGSFHIYYEYSDTSELTVICESNLLIYVETAVFNNELEIRTPNHVSIRPHQTIEIYVKGPNVDKIHLSGSGLIHTDTVSSPKLDLSISGSGTIETIFYGGELSTSISGSGDVYAYAECDYFNSSTSGSGNVNIEGYCDDAYFKISGSGDVKAYDFPLNNLEVKISGSGNIYTNVSENIEVRISGSGDIHYLGNPRINSSISGSGRLINED